MTKRNHISVFLKVLLTDDGYARRESILESKKDCVCFGNVLRKCNSKKAKK